MLATPTSGGDQHLRVVSAYAFRVTFPALRQEVHTFRRFGVPATTARTRWMLGFQRRLVRRCECEMLWPKPGPLPQTSQLAATVPSPDQLVGAHLLRTNTQGLLFLCAGLRCPV